MPEVPDRCADCGRPLPVGWLRTRGCPWCNPEDPSLGADASHKLAEAGHPAIARVAEGDAMVLRVRLTTTFGRVWLALTVLIFGGLAVPVFSQPEPATLALFAVFGGFFLIFGLAYSASAYRIRVTPAAVTVRWSLLGPLGWTWTLPAGEAARFCLAYRGFNSNSRPPLAVVMISGNREIHFGSFLPDDVKAVLVATLRDYYSPVT